MQSDEGGGECEATNIIVAETDVQEGNTFDVKLDPIIDADIDEEQSTTNATANDNVEVTTDLENVGFADAEQPLDVTFLGGERAIQDFKLAESDSDTNTLSFEVDGENGKRQVEVSTAYATNTIEFTVGENDEQLILS